MAGYGTRCPNCQTVNRPGARFCSQCSTALETTAPTSGGVVVPPSASTGASFDVPPAPHRSEGQSFRGALVAAVVFAVVLVAAGVWYFGVQGSSLAELPLIGATSVPPAEGVPTLFSQPATLFASGPAATLVAGAPATVLAGAPSTLATRVTGVLKPLTPNVVPTLAPAAAQPTPSTPTAQPDAQVIVESANLRAGPATVFNILGVLHKDDPLEVTGRNVTADWLHVKTQTGGAGWVATSLVKLNQQLGEVGVESVIPTPPPAPPPAPPAMPGTQRCPSGPALVSVTNRGGVGLVVVMQGAQNYVVDMAPGQTKNICLARGPYQYIATATSNAGAPEQGAMAFLSTSPVCWSLPAAAGAGAPCAAPTDLGAYTPPMGGELPFGPAMK